MKKLWPWILAGAGAYAYGSLVEAKRIQPERRTLRLKRWPKSLDGYRIGLIGDMHIRDRNTVTLTRAALSWLVDQNPDVLVFVGDLIEDSKNDPIPLLEFALEEAEFFRGRAVAIPGNQDYKNHFPREFEWVLAKYGIRLLQNQVWSHDGIEWLGIDSANAEMADPFGTILKADPTKPMVALWHEPDMVDVLPIGPELMLSGHSHGGQFGLPGWTPMKTRNGRKYVRGFYPHAPTPLYVTRGLATTFLPARLFCPPEVTVLTIRLQNQQ